MSLNAKLTALLTEQMVKVESFMKDCAKQYGYPENPGMPPLYEVQNILEGKLMTPERDVHFPPRAQTLIPNEIKEILVGRVPSLNLLERHFYTNTNGYYNFYIEEFKNMYFLPDFISRFIQIRFQVYADVTLIEIFRSVFFLFLWFIYFFLNYRQFSGWFIIINPYVTPWVYMTTITDFFELYLGQYIPSVMGVNLVISVMMLIIGKIADTLNHLVLTFPYLPSEGVRKGFSEPLPGHVGPTSISQNTYYYRVFEGLPKLWQDYPIPNELREFWVNERKDIVNFMQTYYPNVNVLPDDPPTNLLVDSLFNMLHHSSNIDILPDGLFDVFLSN